jgi:anti-sigma B factor antagonist
MSDRCYMAMDVGGTMGGALVSRRLLKDGSVVLDLQGELDVAATNALRDILDETIRTTRPPAVIVGLRHVPFVDSTGMEALLEGYRAACLARVRFVVREIAPRIEKQLRAAGVHEKLVPQTA